MRVHGEGGLTSEVGLPSRCLDTLEDKSTAQDSEGDPPASPWRHAFRTGTRVSTGQRVPLERHGLARETVMLFFLSRTETSV
jgi:hypothetical protein